MIFDLVLDAFMWVIGLILDSTIGMVPGLPGFVQDAIGQTDTVLVWVYSLDSWLPTTVVIMCAGAVLSVFFVAMTIQTIRLVLSYVTFGGGAT
jgi:hypothetical protein